MADDPLDGRSVLDPDGVEGPHELLPGLFGRTPLNGWIDHCGRRLYLASGTDGFRLLHPHSYPDRKTHVENAAVLDQVLSSSTSLLIHAPGAMGKSLVTALLVAGHAEAGRRVLYLTGIPTHDLGDGDRVVHCVQQPGGSVGNLVEAFERWSPDVVCVDLPPTKELSERARHWQAGGILVTMTLRAPDASTARESLRFLLGENASWSLLSPWPAGNGPSYELLLEAA